MKYVAPRDPARLLSVLRRGERPLSVEIETLLDRLDRFEETLQTLLPDESPGQRRERLLAEARALEERWPRAEERPPLFGLVVGVKDLFHARGFPTRAGSRLPAETFRHDETPPAASLQRLQEAGALVLGKTVTTEFAYFGPGPTRNPWNPEHTPGGSSSGSAAAVAAGFCHMALGTQTIGSISRPASFCGIAGYKPSYDRVSPDGIIPFSPSADHVGVLAASARALRLIAPVLTRHWNDRGTHSSADPPHDTLRHQLGTVLVPDDAYLEQAAPESLRALESLCERLQGIGVTPLRVKAFPDIEEINRSHQEMIAAEFAQVHASWFAEHHGLYHPRSKELVERGLAIPQEVYARACGGRQQIRDRIQETLDRHGATLWLSPAAPGEAPRGIDSTGSPLMNLPWTYAGVPTVALPLTSLPHGTGPGGLPLGVQVAGHFGSDEVLLDRAILLEEALR
ncbi:hypothetical protein AU468_02485 [Alkalispirochaeta sphaeroplastigenens]|uniref:Amidase domain-containing protein n=1 Tax=Alkalispirochaeta sphaeroplastigenens TaxID=1187066 RepID=A0A2S4JZ50_9SPIO|nr:amidase [Alkalispirochaeta sphaeroplastigenens]POR04783.1 hypothetical protein AU468_02485 [Alkalispirochaeta sphaeroplastigenens]